MKKQRLNTKIWGEGEDAIKHFIKCAEAFNTMHSKKYCNFPFNIHYQKWLSLAGMNSKGLIVPSKYIESHSEKKERAERRRIDEENRIRKKERKRINKEKEKKKQIGGIRLKHRLKNIAQEKRNQKHLRHLKNSRLPYYEYLQTDTWKQLADYTKKKAAYKCQLCSSTECLNAHHRSYKNRGVYEREKNDLVCLCIDCHKRFHKICND